MDQETKFLRAWVSGKVQGVWFRQSTKQTADRLGIKGYAKNLSDGRVEIEAWGLEADLLTLQEFISKGPEAAVVEEVASTISEAERSPPDHFSTL